MGDRTFPRRMLPPSRLRAEALQLAGPTSPLGGGAVSVLWLPWAETPSPAGGAGADVPCRCVSLAELLH